MTQTIAGNTSTGSPKPVEIGDHKDQFPHPKAAYQSANTYNAGPIKYLHGSGTGGCVVNITFATETGIGTLSNVTIIGVYPTWASSVTWVSGGTLTVY